MIEDRARSFSDVDADLVQIARLERRSWRGTVIGCSVALPGIFLFGPLIVLSESYWRHFFLAVPIVGAAVGIALSSRHTRLRRELVRRLPLVRGVLVDCSTPDREHRAVLTIRVPSADGARQVTSTERLDPLKEKLLERHGTIIVKIHPLDLIEIFVDWKATEQLRSDSTAYR